MKVSIPHIVAVCALSMTSACATIDRGTTEPFEIQTSPSGAEVRTSLGKGCAPTPCVIPNISREADFTVSVSKEGYKTRSYKVMHARSEGTSAHLMTNVFTTAGVGAVIDANNGSMQELHPNPLIVALEPKYNYATAGQKPVERIVDDVLDRYDRQND